MSYSRGHNHGLTRSLRRWYKDNANTKIYTSPITYKSMKESTKSYHPPYAGHMNQMGDSALTHIKSGPERHLVIDNTSRILVYKFQIPLHLVETLARTALHLPHPNPEAHRRKHYERVYYALWADSSKDIMLSSEYQHNLPASKEFLDANQAFFDRLSMELRLLSPESYIKYKSVDKNLKGDQQRLGGAWHGVVVNRQIGSDDDLKMHQDWKDYPKGFNAVVPWGEYVGWS
ncbi:MAG: hypothetical protein M1816_004028 [Peltula sp. TS41687]|nr:MAG: hypothetical protein M1816_004028 [Peltula sp. TS41687]